MKENIYESKSVQTLVLIFSFPAIISLLVEIMASVVDTVFAGHLGADSINALTAMGLLSPLLSLYTAIQALYAVPASVYVARHLNDKSKCDSYLSTAILVSLFVSVFISVFSFLRIDNILYLLGAEKQVFLLAKRYLRIQLLSNIFSSLGYTLTSCIRAFGYPGTELIFTSLSVVVNIIANAFFVFGFQLEFTGLALGTLVSEAFCMVLAFIWLAGKQLMPHLYEFRKFKIGMRVWELFRLGFAQMMIQSLGGCMIFFMNSSLMLYSSLSYVAVWNIVQKIYILLLTPIVGITQGVQTVIAYYSGQSQEKRMRKAIYTTVLCTVLWGCTGILLVFLFGDKFLKFFGISDAILSESTDVLKTIFLTFPIMGIFYTILMILEVTGHEIKAVRLTLLRQFFFVLPLIYLLPSLFSRVKNAVFWAIPVSDLLVLSFIVISRLILSLKRRNR